MKAIRMHGYGASDVLRLEELEDPEPGAGEVRVRIGASALNHVDIDVREGTSRMDIELPHILGFETAGTIERVGAGVDGWRAGDRVVPYAYALRKGARALGGGYADRIVVPSDGLAKTPEALDDVAAAAVQLAFGTAWHMLHARGRLAAGETVLISSVSAGVASAAVQVAHRAGATTIGTSSSPAKLERAMALGLDHGIDYTREDVAERVAEITGGRGVDLAIEHVGGERFPEALKALAERGRLVTCGAHAGEVVDLDIIPFFRAEQSILGSRGHSVEELGHVLALAARGELVPLVGDTFPLAGAAAAMDRLASREVFGKVVLVP